jgi:hypothetical protein
MIEMKNNITKQADQKSSLQNVNNIQNNNNIFKIIIYKIIYSKYIIIIQLILLKL